MKINIIKTFEDKEVLSLIYDSESYYYDDVSETSKEDFIQKHSFEWGLGDNGIVYIKCSYFDPDNCWMIPDAVDRFGNNYLLSLPNMIKVVNKFKNILPVI